MRFGRTMRREQRGSAQIEFALTILVVMFFIFWTWELIMVMYTYSTLADAAKEGVRYAIVHGKNNSNGSGPGSTDVAGDNVEARVRDFARMSLHDVSGMSVERVWLKNDGSTPATTNAPPTIVRVTVSYPFIPYINLPWTPPTIHASAEGRIAN